jgi:hypothetical protein
MDNQPIRFAVTDGVRRAATWVCFTGRRKRDIYLACREFGGCLKVSLHGSGDWRIAYTEEFFKKNLGAFPSKPNNRAIMQWPRPPQIAEGMTLAFRIITPYPAVSHAFDIPLSKPIISIPIPPENRAAEIDIIITAPDTPVSGWPCKRSMNTLLVDSMPLDTGDKVWIVHRVTDIPDFRTHQGAPRYFNGKNVKDLERAKNLRLLWFGSAQDGSRFIVDAIGTFTTEKQTSPT